MYKKFVSIAFAFLAALALVGCDKSPSEPMFTQEQLQDATKRARADGAASEATKADGKLAAAKLEIQKIASETARTGGYSAKANCNVLPGVLGNAKAATDFPAHYVSMYKDACVAEVATMNAERKQNADRAVAKQKERDRKIAAAKEKRENFAQAVKACEKQPAGPKRDTCKKDAARRA